MWPPPSFLAAWTVVLDFASTALSHPGENIDALEARWNAHVRHTVADLNTRALSQCNDAEAVHARKMRAKTRRMATFERLRAERGLHNEEFLHRRNLAQFNKWGETSHDKTSKVKVGSTSSHADLFGSNSTCIMAPDNIIGPYFVRGEQLRSKVDEGHKGVPVHLEVQFVDVRDCEPARGLLVDLWQANASGVYSGVDDVGQAGFQTTFLRGAQPTDRDGVAEFDTIFPGHYRGRASHQHVSAHTGGRLHDNNTYSGGTVSHIAQLFYDQSLVAAVEKLAPYNANRTPLTANRADSYTGYAATANYDPFPEYALLSANDLSQGIFMWIEIGLNTSSNWDQYATHAATVGPNGGVANPKYSQWLTLTPPPTHG